MPEGPWLIAVQATVVILVLALIAYIMLR